MDGLDELLEEHLRNSIMTGPAPKSKGAQAEDKSTAKSKDANKSSAASSSIAPNAPTTAPASNYAQFTSSSSW